MNLYRFSAFLNVVTRIFGRPVSARSNWIHNTSNPNENLQKNRRKPVFQRKFSNLASWLEDCFPEIWVYFLTCWLTSISVLIRCLLLLSRHWNSQISVSIQYYEQRWPCWHIFLKFWRICCTNSSWHRGINSRPNRRGNQSGFCLPFPSVFLEKRKNCFGWMSIHFNAAEISWGRRKRSTFPDRDLYWLQSLLVTEIKAMQVRVQRPSPLPHICPFLFSALTAESFECATSDKSN